MRLFPFIALSVSATGEFSLLYLSRYEGFGLPILEVLRCDCPIICLRAPACKEVGEETVLYLDEQEPHAIVKLVQKLPQPKERQAIAMAKLQNTARFNWHRSVEPLVRAYNNSLLKE